MPINNPLAIDRQVSIDLTGEQIEDTNSHKARTPYKAYISCQLPCDSLLICDVAQRLQADYRFAYVKHNKMRFQFEVGVACAPLVNALVDNSELPVQEALKKAGLV